MDLTKLNGNIKNITMKNSLIIGACLLGQLCAYSQKIDSKSVVFPELRENQLNYQVSQDIFNNTIQKSGSFCVELVFHVVYTDSTDASENIPDHELESFVEILNENYNNLNAHSIRPVFGNIAANAEIQFNIAQIIRVETDLAPFSMPDALKSVSTGGSDAVDPENYANIWIGDISGMGGILGYAYLPTSMVVGQWLDGVVIMPEGLTNDSVVLTREMGHYLGLENLWGDGSDCNTNDGIPDTPGSYDGTYLNCDVDVNSCNDGFSGSGVDLPDMYENFMSNSSCGNLFTQGQVDVMRSVLLNERASLAIDCATVSIEEEIFEEKKVERTLYYNLLGEIIEEPVIDNVVNQMYLKVEYYQDGTWKSYKVIR